MITKTKGRNGHNPAIQKPLHKYNHTRPKIILKPAIATESHVDILDFARQEDHAIHEVAHD